MSGRKQSASEPTAGSLADLQCEANPVDVARTIVLRRLTAAPRTYAQLHADLIRRGIPAEAVEQVLDRFVEVGLINDAEYAQMWVRSRHLTRGNSRSVLRRELRDRGVAREQIDAAVDTITDEAEWRRAGELVRRKLPSTVRLERDARWRRLTSLLARRGYPPSVCFGVVKEVLADESGLFAPEDLVLHDVQIEG